MDQQELIPSGPTTYSQWPGRRKISLRRRKLPSSRLGGKKPARGFFLVRLFRRARLRLAKLRRANMLMKLKLYYKSLVKDIMEGTATLEAVQQRMLMETSFAIPVMGVSFNNSFSNHVYGTY